MGKVKAVKQPKQAKTVKPKSVKENLSQLQNNLPCSPPTRSNAARTSGNTILDLNEQKSFKMWISEIKQIQGYIICRCGLSIQEGPTMPQKLQEDTFFREFPSFYERSCKDPLLGKRISKIPLKYLTVVTSKATDTISGEKMRKKYSSMKTYMNNTLSPIFSRYHKTCQPI